MKPKELIIQWVEAFNKKDADLITELYAVDAVNHQAPNEPVTGKKAIKDMFSTEFSQADMTCLIEKIFHPANRYWLEHPLKMEREPLVM